MKPETLLRATRLIRTGEVIEVGHVLSADMLISATRRFDMHVKRTFMNPQSNKRGSNEEVVLSEIDQVAPEPRAAAGRRGHHPHGQGQAVGEGQRDRRADRDPLSRPVIAHTRPSRASVPR